MEHGLDVGIIALLAACVVGFSLFSARLRVHDVTAPMAFVLLGLVLANGPLAVVDVPVGGEGLRTLAEVTLALLLFHDAAYVELGKLRHDAGLPIRLLAIGLPLTIGLGVGLAVLLFSDLDPWAAAVIAAAVSPTDAALGQAVTEDPQVPARIRRNLSVESGLNDGIATPFVLFFVAVAAEDAAAQSTTGVAPALGEMGIGLLVGVAVGLAGGAALAVAKRRDWAAEDYRAILVLALALLSYAGSVALGGNGFIAAFVGGLAFGRMVSEPVRDMSLRFDIRTGELLSLLVWFFFGATMLPSVVDTTWQIALFAVLALTAMRMLPVALATLGSGIDRGTVAFVGWFGPRGMASVVFALIAFDSIGGPTGDTVLTTISLTIALSVIAHGLSAQPWAMRYAMHYCEDETAEAAQE